MVPTRQCSPLTHQWVGVTLWGHTTAQWRMTEESLQAQWLYQVRLENLYTSPKLENVEHSGGEPEKAATMSTCT